MKPFETVRAWHAAVNAGDLERLVALSSNDIEVAGPRGSGRGEQLLRDWFGRAGVRLEPLQTFSRDTDVVVVEQRATWAAPEGTAASPPRMIAVLVAAMAERLISVFG